MQSGLIQSSFIFIQIVLLSVVFGTLPLFPKISSISLALLFVFSFFYNSKQTILKLPKVYFLFPILFLAYVLSGFFSENLDFWIKDLETKLSFIIVPIIFLNLRKDVLKYREGFFLVFIAGVLTSALLSYLKGMECWNEEHARFCFESSQLAYNFHPTYLSIYYITAIIIAWTFSFVSRLKWLWLFLAISITIILGYFIYHFYSLGPWIGVMFTVLLLLFYVFLRRKQFVKFLLSIIVLCVVFLFAVNKFDLFESDVKVVRQEITDFTNSSKKYYEKNKGNTSSVKARIIIWGISVDLVNKHKFGVGGGDIKDVLLNEYNKLGLEEYEKRSLNPHNQYLQTSLAVGVLFGIFLFITLISLIVYSVKIRNVILLSVLSLLLVSMFFESILEKQAGVVFFMFMIYYSLGLSIHDAESNQKIMN